MVVSTIQEWTATDDSPWVFPGRGHGHLHPRSMQAVVRELMMVVEIKDIRLAQARCRHPGRLAPRRHWHYPDLHTDGPRRSQEETSPAVCKEANEHLSNREEQLESNVLLLLQECAHRSVPDRGYSEAGQ